MEIHVITLLCPSMVKEIKETKWSDVSRIDTLMAIQKVSGFEEVS